ncbi:MAG: hypothetical protein M3164_00600 [Actinomycetota bacterium]|nr:hypothetical protein [Actinomycetota bacterium]
MKRLTGLALLMIIASLILGAFALPALAADDDDDDEPENIGGLVIGEGDAPDCVEGSCGGMILEDPEGRGPNCDGGNCGGNICAGPDCGSCEGGNCGGSISGEAEKEKKKVAIEEKEVVKKEVPARRARTLPRTGPLDSAPAMFALGAGLLLVGAFYVFVAHPATKLAWSMISYRPRRRL